MLGDALPEFACLGVTGNERRTVFACGSCVSKTVEPKPRLLIRAVRTVAEKTTVGENGPNVATVTDGRGRTQQRNRPRGIYDA